MECCVVGTLPYSPESSHWRGSSLLQSPAELEPLRKLEVLEEATSSSLHPQPDFLLLHAQNQTGKTRKSDALGGQQCNLSSSSSSVFFSTSCTLAAPDARLVGTAKRITSHQHSLIISNSNITSPQLAATAFCNFVKKKKKII